LGTLPLQAPELAIQEMNRCVNELGLAGIQIGSHVNDWNLDADEVFFIFVFSLLLHSICITFGRYN